MNHENKIAIVVKNDLLDWQKLNVVAFLASAVAIAMPETHGGAFITASKSCYLPFLRQTVNIYSTDKPDEIQRTFQRAKDRDLQIGIYTEDLFATKNEAANLLEISKVTDEDLKLAGIVIYGAFRKVNKALDKLKFHP